ncbi:MAG: DUF460 domain-containing protein [Candidatus Nanohaloarchaea archaeon]
MHLIVGVDPGATSAVAAYNLEGELVLLESGKEFSKQEIIKQLVRTGKPVVVGCDKKKMPATVEKIASSVGAEKFEPEEDLDTVKKRELGKGKNSHEEDASASARHAYNQMRKNIRKIGRIADRTDKTTEEVAELYFEGKTGDLKT